MAKASKMNFESGGKMAEEESEEGGGGGKKFLIVLILLLLLLIGGGAAAYMFLFSDGGDESASEEGQTSQKQIEVNTSAMIRKETNKITNPIYTPPKKYVVNLRDGRHFLTVTFVAVLEDPEALAFLQSREFVIDDIVISYLGTMTSEEIRDQAGKELLKNELYKKVNNVFTQSFYDDSDTKDYQPVKNVLFTEFILN